MLSYRTRRASALVLLFSLGGCYAQQPIGLAVPQPETRVTAQLTDMGSVGMANQLGPGAYEVEGDVHVATADTIKLRVRRVLQRGNIATTWQSELVAFPRTALTNVTEKKLSRARSWAAAGIITGLVILTGRLMKGAVTGEDRGGGPVNPS